MIYEVMDETTATLHEGFLERGVQLDQIMGHGDGEEFLGRAYDYSEQRSPRCVLHVSVERLSGVAFSAWERDIQGFASGARTNRHPGPSRLIRYMMTRELKGVGGPGSIDLRPKDA